MDGVLLRDLWRAGGFPAGSSPGGVSILFFPAQVSYPSRWTDWDCGPDLQYSPLFGRCSDKVRGSSSLSCDLLMPVMVGVHVGARRNQFSTFRARARTTIIISCPFRDRIPPLMLSPPPLRFPPADKTQPHDHCGSFSFSDLERYSPIFFVLLSGITMHSLRNHDPPAPIACYGFTE